MNCNIRQHVVYEFRRCFCAPANFIVITLSTQHVAPFRCLLVGIPGCSSYVPNATRAKTTPGLPVPRCFTVYTAERCVFEWRYVEASVGFPGSLCMNSLCMMNASSGTGDVVTRKGDETILTDKNGRRFMKAEIASSVGAHVSRERLNL